MLIKMSTENMNKTNSAKYGFCQMKSKNAIYQMKNSGTNLTLIE